MKFLLIVLTLALCSVAWCDKLPTIEMIFRNMGKYEFKNENGENVVKTYYESRELQLSWLKAFVYCKKFEMDLVALPTEAEANFFLSLCIQQKSHLVSSQLYLGATYVGVGTNEFYWMTTGQRVNYSMKFAASEPNNLNGNEKYLAVFKESGTLNDFDGATQLSFICQRISNTTK